MGGIQEKRSRKKKNNTILEKKKKAGHKPSIRERYTKSFSIELPIISKTPLSNEPYFFKCSSKERENLWED
jgi:hypothetical protein